MSYEEEDACHAASIHPCMHVCACVYVCVCVHQETRRAGGDAPSFRHVELF